MKKIKPYLIFAGTLFVILAIYKFAVQPRIAGTAAEAYLPKV